MIPYGGLTPEESYEQDSNILESSTLNSPLPKFKENKGFPAGSTSSLFLRSTPSSRLEPTLVVETWDCELALLLHKVLARRSLHPVCIQIEAASPDR